MAEIDPEDDVWVVDGVPLEAQQAAERAARDANITVTAWLERIIKGRVTEMAAADPAFRAQLARDGINLE